MPFTMQQGAYALAVPSKPKSLWKFEVKITVAGTCVIVLEESADLPFAGDDFMCQLERVALLRERVNTLPVPKANVSEWRCLEVGARNPHLIAREIAARLLQQAGAKDAWPDVSAVGHKLIATLGDIGSPLTWSLGTLCLETFYPYPLDDPSDVRLSLQPYYADFSSPLRKRGTTDEEMYEFLRATLESCAREYFRADKLKAAFYPEPLPQIDLKARFAWNCLPPPTLFYALVGDIMAAAKQRWPEE